VLPAASNACDLDGTGEWQNQFGFSHSCLPRAAWAGT